MTPPTTPTDTRLAALERTVAALVANQRASSGKLDKEGTTPMVRQLAAENLARLDAAQSGEGGKAEAFTEFQCPRCRKMFHIPPNECRDSNVCDACVLGATTPTRPPLPTRWGLWSVLQNRWWYGAASQEWSSPDAAQAYRAQHLPDEWGVRPLPPDPAPAAERPPGDGGGAGMNSDELRDELAGIAGWKAIGRESTLRWFKSMSERQIDHPIPPLDSPTALGVVAGLLPEGWRWYNTGWCREDVESQAIQWDTARIVKVTGPNETLARAACVIAAHKATPDRSRT